MRISLELKRDVYAATLSGKGFSIKPLLSSKSKGWYKCWYCPKGAFLLIKQPLLFVVVNSVPVILAGTFHNWPGQKILVPLIAHSSHFGPKRPIPTVPDRT